MPRLPWRVSRTLLYFRYMGRRQTRREIEPERLLAGLEEYEGLWVAVKDRKVIAAADNSRDLVANVRQLGDAGKDAVAQFVPRYSEEVVIGVG
jgi:hypothetical protein